MSDQLDNFMNVQPITLLSNFKTFVEPALPIQGGLGPTVIQSYMQDEIETNDEEIDLIIE